MEIKKMSYDAITWKLYVGRTMLSLRSGAGQVRELNGQKRVGTNDGVHTARKVQTPEQKKTADWMQATYWKTKDKGTHFKFDRAGRCDIVIALKWSAV